MMRTLHQPGPVHPDRIDVLRAEPRLLRFRLQPGLTLNEALTAPLVEAGFQSAAVTVRGATMDPFRYVRPARSTDDNHVAWFSATHAPAGASTIEQANATFGWAGGAPSVHCHAVWCEPDGSRRGGHILPLESLVAEGAEVTAWGFASVRIEALPDPETNFTLFQPVGPSSPDATAIIARVKPNEDIITAIETIAHRHALHDATVRGSLGSLIGARFANVLCATGEPRWICWWSTWTVRFMRDG
jgi:predicted DNA-binding protein with PD1-like motif